MEQGLGFWVEVWGFRAETSCRYRMHTSYGFQTSSGQCSGLGVYRAKMGGADSQLSTSSALLSSKTMLTYIL